MSKTGIFIISLLFAFVFTQSISSASAAETYIISPADGEQVSETFTIQFGLTGMDVAPAGVEKPNTGHHHLLIDTNLPNLNFAVPKDPHHLHFGGGQTIATITLAPGTHTLQLLLGDHMHQPHDPPVISEKITIIVVADQ